MNQHYPWVANTTKLQVAISKMKGRLAENGKPLTEKNIKEEYIRMGGLVLAQPKQEFPNLPTTPKVAVPEEFETAEVTQSEPVTTIIKKRGRPAKNDKASTQTSQEQED